MTRLTVEPTVRLCVDDAGQEYVIELRDATVTMRPKRSRAGGESEVRVPWGAIYRRALMSRVEAERGATPTLKRKVKRGLLSVGR